MDIIKQVTAKITIDASIYSEGRMCRTIPINPFWKVFAPWKKEFKKLNPNIKRLCKETKKELYREYFHQYYYK